MGEFKHNLWSKLSTKNETQFYLNKSIDIAKVIGNELVGFNRNNIDESSSDVYFNDNHFYLLDKFIDEFVFNNNDQLLINCSISVFHFNYIIDSLSKWNCIHLKAIGKF
jgi:hypothetical protein